MAAACGSLQQMFESPFNHRSFDNLFEDASLSHHNLNEGGPCCLMNSESLQMCTEGLGFESLDGVEDSYENESNAAPPVGVHSNPTTYHKRAKSCLRSFPPPISSLGKAGKASVCFKSYRQDGRFVLQEVRIPKQEYLHASREDGRLRLCFVHPEDDDDDDDDDDDILDKEEIHEEDDEAKEDDIS